MKLQIGDQVHAEKFVYDRWYMADGPVERIMVTERPPRTYVYIGGDAYDVDDVTLTAAVTRQSEARLPDWATGWCHYCGMPARGWSFFDTPACSECGG